MILLYAVLDLVSTFLIRNTFRKIQAAITEKVVKETDLLEENTVKDAEIEEELEEKKEEEKEEPEKKKKNKKQEEGE